MLRGLAESVKGKFVTKIFFQIMLNKVLKMVLIYIYMGVPVYWCECAVYLCVYVCVISNESASKRPHYVSDLGKSDALLHRTHIKVVLVLRYQGSTFIDP